MRWLPRVTSIWWWNPISSPTTSGAYPGDRTGRRQGHHLERRRAGNGGNIVAAGSADLHAEALEMLNRPD
jgi:hypothetical protein